MLYDLCITSSILSFHTFLCLLCSWLWILCASLGLQNLTLGTKRCSMICASFLLFLSFHAFLFLLCSWLWILYAPLGLQNLTLGTKRCSMIYAYFLQFFFLYFPFPSLFLTVGFMRPSGFKTLRQELPDSHIFVRHFVPSKMVHWGSQA